uniref:Cholesterol side-chain cleavage enzyme, mitochondrial n=1 Tax=Callorhinchus milii TaxID=7868 RepID=A0A4W3HKK1_CALMI
VSCYPVWDLPMTFFPSANKNFLSTSKIYVSSSNNALKSYDTLPGEWKSKWSTLYKILKKNDFKNLHKIMVNKFDMYGPIFREQIGHYGSVNIIKPEDAATLFKAEGMFPRRLSVLPWLDYREHRKQKCGVLLQNGEEWRKTRMVLNKEVIAPNIIHKFVPFINDVVLDFVSMLHKRIKENSKDEWTFEPMNDLFKFSLESICHVLYGERLGLLEDSQKTACQQYIDSITLMFRTTTPMLYIPPRLLKLINSKIWVDHVDAWDVIFAHANICIEKIRQQYNLGLINEKEYSGVLANLLIKEKLPIDNLKSSIVELMAGGVDTTSITLLWTMYELARNPNLQEKLRNEILAAEQETHGDLFKTLQFVPLVKATLKETLRLYPVAVSLQRYITEDIVLQNYVIPTGTLVQVGLYAMGRNAEIFTNPEQYIPERWLKTETNYFKNLGFGFGSRQCIGRRIAETEMQLFLIQMLKNFNIETSGLPKLNTNFDLILVPEIPINLTLKIIN